MKLKFRAILILMIFVSCLHSNPVKADEGGDPHQIYLPLVSYEPYVNPWIGPWGGYVVCMVANPIDPNEIFAGTWGNGVFKSVDGGLTWARFSTGLGDLYINSIAMDPQNSKIIYAGTYYDEVYKTTTGGDVWYHSSQGLMDGDIIYTIGIDPHDPDIVYIGTRNKSYNSEPWHGVVYRSQNEGINWTPVLTNVGGSKVQDWAYDVLVNPKDHSMVFAALHEHGVYRSWDFGNHWEPVNQNGLTDLSGRALLINPINASNALYVGTWHRTGTYKSIDNGASWVHHPLSAKVYTMDLDPIQPANLYMADFYNGVFKSANGGDSWNYAGLVGNLMYTVMVNPDRHQQVFAGTAGNGIFRSDSFGSVWVHSQAGLYNTKVVGFAVVPGQPNRFFAGAYRGGFYSSDNAGETWQQSNRGFNNIELNGFMLHPDNADRVYALSTNQGLFTCSVSNCTWITTNSGLPAADLNPNEVSGFLPANEVEAELLRDNEGVWNEIPKLSSVVGLNEMVFANSNSQVVYLATSGAGVYRSQNGAGSWVSAGLNGKTVTDLGVNPANAAVVYAAVSGSSSVYTSINSGGNWIESTALGGVVNDLATSPLEPGIVYAATSTGVFKRMDGKEWVSVGLNGVSITAIAAHPAQNGLLVAAGPGGVYTTKNGGINWVQGPDELISVEISSVCFDETDPKMAFLTTTTAGVYRLKIK